LRSRGGSCYSPLGKRWLAFCGPHWQSFDVTVCKNQRLFCTTQQHEQSAEDMVKVDKRGVFCWVTLNRPEIHNAFNEVVITRLTSIFQQIKREQEQNPLEMRAVILTGNGQSFSAGADLKWMKKMVNYTEEENEKDSHQLFDMVESIYSCPVPVIGRINGSAIGGGAGLVAACDFAYAVGKAMFGFTEVKLGLLPAVISPFVMNKIGAGNCSKYFLTGEKFGTEEAARIGLIHSYYDSVEDIDQKIEQVQKEIEANSPIATRNCKLLIRRVANATMVNGPVDLKQELCSLIAQARISKDGQEGLSSFLGKKKPAWAIERNNTSPQK